MENVYISIMGRTKNDTGVCAHALLEETNERKLTPEYHVFTFKPGTKEAVENEDKHKMQNLKEHRLSEGSSMDTDSLPDYDHLYPDGGDHDNDGDLVHHEKGHQMKRLKPSYNSSATLPNSHSVVSTSSSYTEPSTSQSGGMCEQVQCHVYEIPWDTDMGLMWSIFPILNAVFVLVLDVDSMQTNSGLTDEYIDMVKSVGDLSRHKGLEGMDENMYPKLYLVGHTNKTGNDAKNSHQKIVKTLRNKLGMCLNINVDPGEFLITSKAFNKKYMQRLKDLLTTPRFHNRPLSQTNLAEKPIFDFFTYCKSCAVSMEEVLQKLGNISHSSLVRIIQDLHIKGTLVYIDDVNYVWTRPDLLTRACAVLCQIPSGDLTKETIKCRLSVQLQLEQHATDAADAAELCMKALEKLGILAEPPVNYNMNGAGADVDGDQCHLALNLKRNSNDPIQQIDPGQHQTAALRIRLKVRKPAYVSCGIFMDLVQRGWKPNVKSDNANVFQNWAIFNFLDKTMSAKIFISVNSSYIHVVIVNYSKEYTIDVETCAKLREDIETAIRNRAFTAYGQQSGGKMPFMSCEIRCNQSKGALNGDDGWNKVNELRTMLENGDAGSCDQHQDTQVPHKITPSAILKVWYPLHAPLSKTSSMETTDDEMSVSQRSTEVQGRTEFHSEQLTERLLSKISKCFGSGWEQFFVENNLGQTEVDISKQNHPGNMTLQVLYCLQIWTKKQKVKATVEMLKRRVKKCDHLTFSYENLEKILAEEAEFNREDF